jgi:hypothetical protein
MDDQQLAKTYAREEAAVIADLRQVGVDIGRLPDILKVRLPRTASQPILAHLRTAQTPAAREFLIRALTDRAFAGDIVPDLVAMFQDGEFAAHHWTIGQAIGVVVTQKYEPLILDLVAQREFGRDREMIVLALPKLKSSRADEMLLALLDDDDVNGHAVKALAGLPPSRLRALNVAAVQRFLDDRRTWVRRSASAVLKKREVAERGDRD